MKPDYIRDWLPAKLRKIMDKFQSLQHVINYDRDESDPQDWSKVNTWMNNLLNTERYPNRSILLEANRLWKLYN